MLRGGESKQLGRGISDFSAVPRQPLKFDQHEVPLTGFDAFVETAIRCLGKARKMRCTPLRPEVVSVLTAWLSERGGGPADPVFPSSRGGQLSADAFQRLVTRQVACASHTCPSLKTKAVTPHTLRYVLSFDYVLSFAIFLGLFPCPSFLHFNLYGLSLFLPSFACCWVLVTLFVRSCGVAVVLPALLATR
jgi:hypothetical protein